MRVGVGRRRRVMWVALLVVAGLLAGCIPGAGAPSDRMGFDGGGRLASGMAADGSASLVRLDALGNVVGVDRVAAGGLAVTSVVPRSARVGESVWVYGTGFGAGLGAQSVTLAGVAAPVAEAVPGRVRVTVGAGTGTGPVVVSVGGSSAQWAGSFSPLGNAPSVSGVAPDRVRPGQTVVVSGSGFSTVPVENQVWVGGVQMRVVAATASSLTVEVPPGLASGPVSVETSLGSGSGGLFVTVPAPVDAGATCLAAGGLGSVLAPGCADGLASVDGVLAG